MATIETPIFERRFEYLVLDFLAYLEFERGLSRNTLDAYRTDLLQFGRFLEEHGVSALEAKPSDVADFLEALARGGQPVSMDQMQPGDLVTYYSDASHVGIYIGDGMMVHASTYGTPVRVAPVDNAPIYNVRRY